MPSPFDLFWQNQSTTGKIVVALERIAEAFRVMAWEISKESGLSPIQIQILIFCLFHDAHMATVSALAEEFHLTKATISESIRTLAAKQLITKKQTDEDLRSYRIVLTSKGKKLAQKASQFADALVSAVDGLPASSKNQLLHGLLQIIWQLQQQEMIHPQRMCWNCRFYRTTNHQPFCTFLQKPLHAADLRVDCPEFQPKLS
ncbi:MAG: MarR family winged helix-turn-helix transcriptional regulator [Thermoflavifilum sp.]|nr:MarR family winged helix-turn-helix transcriptional regulator [Thermoflavifilum sp.]